MTKLRERIAEILWDIDRPSHVPTWDELKEDSHEQCQMERENTLIDADQILEACQELKTEGKREMVGEIEEFASYAPNGEIVEILLNWQRWQTLKQKHLGGE